MISVRCPECEARLEVDDGHHGQEVRCPSCHAVFEALPAGPGLAPGPSRRGQGEDDDYDRPRRRPARYDDDEDDYDRPRRSPEAVIGRAKQTVFLPALLSSIVCILAVVFHAGGAVFIAVNPQVLKNNQMFNFGGPPPPLEVMLAVKGFMVVYGLVATAGSFAMMKLKARPFAIVTMVMQIIPCLDWCCIATLPFGIWGLVVLFQPLVRDGFDLVHEHGDRRPARRRERERDDYDDDEEDDRDGIADRLR